MTNALIFAGGSGTRMNSKSRPKQFLQFYGKELIMHTLENFQNHFEINGIAVVCIEEWIPYLNKLLEKYGIDKVSDPHFFIFGFLSNPINAFNSHPDL